MKKIYFIVLASLFSCQIYCAQGALRRVETTSINRLQGQLRQYRKNDNHLKELHDVLETQNEQLAEYNTLLGNIESGTVVLNQEQRTIIQRQSFQDLIQISNTEIERLSQLSSIIIQSKNIDPSWQMTEYGPVFGCMSFMKNLFVPRDMQSYVYAGIGAVTGLTVFKNMQNTSPTIQISVPQATTNVTIKDDSQQKLAATVAICALGAGGVVAGTQLYNSWMYGQNSRDTLIDKIRLIKTSNAQVGAVFGTIGIHNVLARQGQAIGAVGNQVAQVQAGVAAVNDGVVQLHQGALQDRQVNNAFHQEAGVKFNGIQATQVAHGQSLHGLSEQIGRVQVDVGLDRQANAARHEQVSSQFVGLNQKVDKLAFDQQKFQQFVTSLVTDSDAKSEKRHAEVKKEVQGVKADVAGFRNESAAGYNNLVEMHQQGQRDQREILSLLRNGQQQNRLQLPVSSNNGKYFSCKMVPFAQLQNSCSSDVGLAPTASQGGSGLEEVD